MAAQSSPVTVSGSYIYTVINYIWPFEGNREADVAPGEHEFDTPAIKNQIVNILSSEGHRNNEFFA